MLYPSVQFSVVIPGCLIWTADKLGFDICFLLLYSASVSLGFLILKIKKKKWEKSFCCVFCTVDCFDKWKLHDYLVLLTELTLFLQNSAIEEENLSSRVFERCCTFLQSCPQEVRARQHTHWEHTVLGTSQSSSPKWLGNDMLVHAWMNRGKSMLLHGSSSILKGRCFHVASIAHNAGDEDPW